MYLFFWGYSRLQIGVYRGMRHNTGCNLPFYVFRFFFFKFHLNTTPSIRKMGWLEKQYTRLRVLLLYIGVTVYQKWNHMLVPDGKGQYELRYILNDRLYKIKIRAHRGPRTVVTVEDGWGVDVTDMVIPYMGPNEDYHGQRITPKQLGYDALTITRRNGEIRSYEADDVLV